jgi:hypothetical protein
MLELVKAQIGCQIVLSLTSDCRYMANSNNLSDIFNNQEISKLAAINLVTLVNTNLLASGIFDGIVMDYRYWSKDCSDHFVPTGMYDFMKTLQLNLRPDKNLYLSIPQGYRLNDLTNLSDLDKLVSGYHLYTDAPLHAIVTPLVQLTELSDIAKSFDPTYDVLKGNSTETTLNTLREDKITQNVIPVMPTEGKIYFGPNTDIMIGYGKPYINSTTATPDSIYNNPKVIQIENDPFSNHGNNGLRFGLVVDDVGTLPGTVTTPYQATTLAQMVLQYPGAVGMGVDNIYSDSKNMTRSLIESCVKVFRETGQKQSQF